MIDTLRYEKYMKSEHYIVLHDKIEKTFCIHSSDEKNHTAMITGFSTAARAVEFAEGRVVEIEKSSTS